MSTWDRIRDDDSLTVARQKLSLRDFAHIIRHAQAEYKQVLTTLMDDPHGCRFCDYGVLRNANKGHDASCPYAAGQALLSGGRRANWADDFVAQVEAYKATQATGGYPE